MAKKAKSRTVAVRLISMAMTGYYRTMVRPRQHRPLSMLKYDPVDTRQSWETPENAIAARSLRKQNGHLMISITSVLWGDGTHVRELLTLANANLRFMVVRKQVLFLEQKRGGSK